MALAVVPITGRCRLLVSCSVSRSVSWPGERTRLHTARMSATAQPDHGGATTMPTDAHNNVSREERRALLEQRRAEVARQMRRLAKELADLDRQLDDIEQSDR